MITGTLPIVNYRCFRCVADNGAETMTEIAKVDVPTAAKLLDDLFKKTKTQPALYWLPLTDDEVSTSL